MNNLPEDDIIGKVIEFMARKQRVHYPGAVYHVMVKGNNGERILLEELHKNQYLKILLHYKKHFYFKIYAFCIMDNHAHFLIEVGDIPLSQVMQRVQQVYTQRYNRTYTRTGHVFQQRYKALLCNKEGYLLQLIKYIHYNPVKANIVNSINDYKWSSHSHYTGTVKSDITDVSTVLDVFSENRKLAIKQYLQFMDQAPDEIELKDYLSLEGVNSPTGEENKKLADKMNINVIIETICLNEGIRFDEIARKTRMWKMSDLRKAIVLLSEVYCSITNTALSQILNLPLSMISKIKAGESKRVYLQEIINRFEKKISE